MTSDAWQSPHLAVPSFRSRAEYGASLGDAAYWAPYVREVLGRHGLPLGQLAVGAVGTFPTFLVDRYVAKLFLPTLAKPFGTLFNGTLCHEVEAAILGILAGQTAIPGPALVAAGRLVFGRSGGGADGGTGGRADVGTSEGVGAEAPTPWPYLVMTRV